MKTKISILAITLAALLLLAACTNTTGKITGTSSDTIEIGAIFPLTGDAAAYGIPGQQSIQLAVKEINENGGINGKQLKVIYEDGSCSAKGGASAANKLINVDGVKVILGGFCSGETLGAAPIAEVNHAILFSPGSGSPDITNAGDYIFRNFPSDSSSASKVAKAAIDNGDKTMVIISEQTDYSQAITQVFRKTYTDLGGKILVDETFLTESNDFRTSLGKMKSANADGIYIASQSPSKYNLLLKQRLELGLNQQLYTNEFASASDVLKDYSKEIEGAIFAEPKFDENTKEARTLLKNLESEYGEVKGVLPPVYLATTYDAVYILKEAMEVCGEDSECIKDELYGVKNRIGAAGTLSIDENGDAEFEYVLKEIRNGEVIQK